MKTAEPQKKLNEIEFINRLVDMYDRLAAIGEIALKYDLKDGIDPNAAPNVDDISEEQDHANDKSTNA